MDNNTHANVPLPQGWTMDDKKMLRREDGSVVGKILQEVPGLTDRTKIRVKCQVPGCTYDNTFTRGSESKLRSDAIKFHTSQHSSPCVEIMPSAKRGRTTELVHFVGTQQMTHEKTNALLAISPKFHEMRFAIDNKIINGQMIFELLDKNAPRESLENLFKVLPTIHKEMHEAVFKDLWKQVIKFAKDQICGADCAFTKRWNKEGYDLQYRMGKLLKRMSVAVDNDNLSKFDDLVEGEFDPLKDELELFGVLPEFLEDSKVKLVELTQRRYDQEKMNKAISWFKLVKEDTNPIAWTPYLFEKIGCEHREGIKLLYAKTFKGDFEYKQMCDTRLPKLVEGIAHHPRAYGNALAVDAKWYLPETGEQMELTVSGNHYYYVLGFNPKDLKPAETPMSKEAAHNLLRVPPQNDLPIPHVAPGKVGPFADYIKLCQNVTRLYANRMDGEENRKAFNNAVNDSCQRMIATGSQMPLNFFRSGYEEFCNKNGLNFDYRQLSASSLAEFNIKYFQGANGNVYVSGFTHVTTEEEVVACGRALLFATHARPPEAEEEMEEEYVPPEPGPTRKPGESVEEFQARSYEFQLKPLGFQPRGEGESLDKLLDRVHEFKVMNGI